MPYDASQGGGTRFQQMRARRAAVPSPAVQPGGIGSRGVASGPGGTIYGGGPQVQPGGIGQRATPSGPGGYLRPSPWGASAGPAINAPRSGPGGYMQPPIGIGGSPGGLAQRSGPGGYLQPPSGGQQMRPYMDPFAGGQYLGNERQAGPGGPQPFMDPGRFAGGEQNPYMAQIQGGMGNDWRSVQGAAQQTAQQQMEEMRRRQMMQGGGYNGGVNQPIGSSRVNPTTGQTEDLVHMQFGSGWVPRDQGQIQFPPGLGGRTQSAPTYQRNPYGQNYPDPYSQNR